MFKFEGLRNYLTLLLIVVNCQVFGQFSDDFNDGDFSANPIWTGQTANFIVNTSNELQLNAPAVADTSYLSISTSNINNTSWDFYVRMEFNPSSTSYTRIYLVSDNSNLKGTLNGYFVMAGDTPDEISLYRQDGIATTKIIDGVDGSLNASIAAARIRVTRDGAGNWELLRDTLGGYNFISEGTVLDATYTTNANFGVFCKYTSSRSTKFFFDNMGDPYIDTIIPTLDTVIYISPTQIDVVFSEVMDQTTAETTSNYSVDNGIGSPSTAILDGADQKIVHLTFASSFVSGTIYLLTANNVEDVAGNPISSPSTFNFSYIVYDTPSPQDVIITEFMADPSPQVGIPEVEFVELYNRSSKTFNLAGWKLWDASSSGTFSTYTLGPGEYVLVTGNGNSGQYFVSNSTEISLPSLNNDADAIVIKDDLGNVLDSIYFTTAWYHDNTKTDGGWSIERKHLNSPCSDINNWAASVDVYGGTPSYQNSIWTDQDDITPPYILSLVVNSSNNLVLMFNETMDTTVSANLTIDPSISSLSWNYVDAMQLNIDANTLQVNQLYDLTITGVKDCWGNDIGSVTIQLGLPDSIEAEDLILNEIMFDPLTGGSDYAELYNNSDKILDLQEVFLANWDDSIANYKTISNVQRLIFPKEYVVIAEDTNAVIGDFSIYGVGTFIEADMPTYPNDSGTVYLLSKDSLIIDYFRYDEDYHFELLSSTDGKSLERITFGGGMNNADNWHTAAEYVEWGTPGYENSQLFVPNPNGEVTIDPKIFSPDNDGYQDVVTINLNLQSTDNVVDIEIFDNRGRLIRLLKDNFFVGNEALITWDGINDDGEKAAIGSYIILVSVTDVGGNQTQYKLVVALAGNF
ncbi:MAG: lamin tail domain-containing protein [Crocinitomicaceae bacterium]